MADVKVKTKAVKLNIPSPKELLEAGVHFGHSRRRWHPSMASYIYTEKNKVHVLDLFQTADLLESACQFLYDLAAAGQGIIFVGTKRQAQEIILAEARQSGAMHVTNRWVGGALTNFKEIEKNRDKLVRLMSERESGELNKYTKRERLLIDRQIDKLKLNHGGLLPLKEMPGAIFVVDPRKEKTVVAEAIRLEIPLVALLDTNCDPRVIDYPIPGNDDGIKSISLVVRIVAEAVEAGYRAFAKSGATGEAELKDKGEVRPAESRADEKVKVEVEKVTVKKKTSAVSRAEVAKTIKTAGRGVEKIADSSLSNRSKNSLSQAGFKTIGELKTLSAEDLKGIRGLGAKSIAEIAKFQKALK